MFYLKEIFNDKPDNWIIEYGIHDTFDALSPKYDQPLSVKKFGKIKRNTKEKDIVKPMHGE